MLGQNKFLDALIADSERILQAAKHGFIAPFLALMAVTVGLSVLGLAIFIPYGKRFRVATKDSTLHAF